MTGAYDDDLMDECAGWISAMLEEEDGALIDAGLVFVILRRERDLRAAGAAPPHPELARRLAEALEADGIRGMPDAISPDLILGVLGWEDEFLALAGMPRPAY